VVDTDTYTVTAYTPHLSRYLLGFQEKEVIEEPDVPVPVATSTPTKKHSYGTRIERTEARVLGVSSTATQYTSEQLQQIGVVVEGVNSILKRKELLTEEQKEALIKVLIELVNIL